MKTEKSFDIFSEKIKKAGGEFINHDEYGFSRTMQLDSFGQDVKFIVQSKMVTVKFGDVSLWADSFSIDGCYPNRYKLNLNCSYLGNRVCFIPIEKYKDK